MQLAKMTIVSFSSLKASGNGAMKRLVALKSESPVVKSQVLPLMSLGKLVSLSWAQCSHHLKVVNDT